MMKKKCMSLLLMMSAIFLFTGCDLMNSAKNLIPKFSTETPNLLVGTYQVVKSGLVTKRLVLAKDGTSKLTVGDDYVESGTYVVTYGHLDILQASGTITFISGDGTKKDVRFSFTSDVDDGPQQLVLDGVAFTFVTR